MKNIPIYYYFVACIVAISVSNAAQMELKTIHNDAARKKAAEQAFLKNASGYPKNGSLNYFDIVMYITEDQGNIDAQDREGKTALMHRAGSQHASATEDAHLLLSLDANPNIQDTSGWTALMYAAVYEMPCRQGYKIHMLLDYGANPYLKNKNGKTFFELVDPKLLKDPDVIAALARYDKKITTHEHEYGIARIHQERPRYQRNPLRAAYRLILGRIVKVGHWLDRIVRVGHWVKVIDERDQKFLAIMKKAPKEMLNMQDADGKTAVMRIIDDIVGDTDLHIGDMYSRRTDIIQALIDYGADLNVQDRSGFTALMYTMKHTEKLSVLNMYKKIAAMLLNANANPYIRARDAAHLQLDYRGNLLGHDPVTRDIRTIYGNKNFIDLMPRMLSQHLRPNPYTEYAKNEQMNDLVRTALNNYEIRKKEYQERLTPTIQKTLGEKFHKVLTPIIADYIDDIPPTAKQL